IEGRAKPSFVVSHELPLDQASSAYDKFDKRIAPLVAVAALTDLVLAPVLRHTPFANAYRIIARKPTD
ncbi:hypothetical protein ABZ590_40485, partial [Streptomyces hirsutus]